MSATLFPGVYQFGLPLPPRFLLPLIQRSFGSSFVWHRSLGPVVPPDMLRRCCRLVGVIFAFI